MKITDPDMKRISSLFFTIFFAFCLATFSQVSSANADDIRKPAYAGSFYPETHAELTALIKRLIREVKQSPITPPPNTSLKALIMPHAGYMYSGITAAHISLVLNENQSKRVIVMAPDHRVGFTGGAISDVAAYETPLGRIPMNEDAVTLRGNTNLFQAIPASDRLEHSVEVVLPFLQYVLKNFELIPIVLGHDNGLVDRVTAALDPLTDQNTLLVASSDLSHYLSYPEAVARDRETIKMILDLNAGKLRTRENAACGRIPILVVINLARRHGWQPMLLHYSNSGDTSGDRSRVVGYATIAFYGGLSMQNTSDSSQPLKKNQGQALINLARQTISEKLGKKSISVDPQTLADSAFQDHRGTFVTLTINKQLRGCIGNLDATESILAGIKRNAINAAFHDPRFSQLKAHELDQMDIEISILTEPERLEYGDSKELLSKLRVHVDGVILRKGSASATFLPQVWEQLPRPEQFLSHLCMKAGLPADDWKKSRLEIMTYQVQYFEEEK
jgi:AmmeMemoRadiSam system protein B/AmmeMemoRadiSam system protein A